MTTVCLFGCCKGLGPWLAALLVAAFLFAAWLVDLAIAKGAELLGVTW